MLFRAVSFLTGINMIEITRKIASAWRGFFGSEEGVIGLQWLRENRPALDDKFWQQASGYELCLQRIQQILETERARPKLDENEGDLKS
jgi:hypothetical protein